MHRNPEIKKLLEGLHHPGLMPIEPGLGQVKQLLSTLGNPEQKLPPVIHVAGTNGKGSVCAFLTSILQSAGLRVHRYTSPHLVRFNERIMLADKEISDVKLLHYLQQVQPELQNTPTTFFVATTALAYFAFSEVKADVCILETGMGGRWDATNILDHPLLTIITPISMDHMQYLGSTLKDIAFEKAGIMKKDVTCIIGRQRQEALKELKHQAQQKHTPLRVYGEDWKVEGSSFISNGEAIIMQPNLEGAHQLYNAATVIAACKQIQALKPDWNLANQHMQTGIQHAKWPARLQALEPTHPYAKSLPHAALWLDGGHNEDAARVLAEWLKKQPKPRRVICGMLADKDAEAFVGHVASEAELFIAIDGFAELSSFDKDRLAVFAMNTNTESYCAQSVDSAIEMLAMRHQQGTVLICGSLYLAGNVLSRANPADISPALQSS